MALDNLMNYSKTHINDNDDYYQRLNNISEKLDLLFSDISTSSDKYKFWLIVFSEMRLVDMGVSSILAILSYLQPAVSQTVSWDRSVINR